MPVQSGIGSFRSPRSLLASLAGANRDGTVLPPEIITADGIVFAAGNHDEVKLIQNVGTTVVLLGFGTQPTLDSFHWRLAPDSPETGYGGSFDVSKVNVAVYCLATSGTPKLATIRIVSPEALL